MRSVLPFAAALALTACTTPPAALTTTGTPSAGMGQTANVGSVLVRPLALVEDSRCPINARCVWAGRLVIDAEIIFNGASETLRTRLTLGTPLALGREQVTLVSAEPAKLAGAEGNPPANRFTFEYARVR